MKKYLTPISYGFLILWLLVQLWVSNSSSDLSELMLDVHVILMLLPFILFVIATTKSSSIWNVIGLVLSSIPFLWGISIIFVGFLSLTD